MGMPAAVVDTTRGLSDVASVDQRFADRPRRDGGLRHYLAVVLPARERSR